MFLSEECSLVSRKGIIALRCKEHVVNSFGLQVADAYSTLWFISHYLIIVNAAMDPIIYGLTNESFRRAFRASARWLFGASVAAPALHTPRPPIHRLEPRNLGLKHDSRNQWFSSPEKMKSKTRHTDGYI
jgi:hypothetical protein